MPQMSPMYWTLLLLYTLMLMYMYISMLYFTPPSPSQSHHFFYQKIKPLKKIKF